MTSKKTVEALERSAADANLLTESPQSQWSLTLRRFRTRTSGMIGLVIVLSLIFIAVFAPIIAPYDRCVWVTPFGFPVLPEVK